jgi:hypothetical protein
VQAKQAKQVLGMNTLNGPQAVTTPVAKVQSQETSYLKEIDLLRQDVKPPVASYNPYKAKLLQNVQIEQGTSHAKAKMYEQPKIQ